MASDVPSFESWAAYCFEHGHSDFEALSKATGDEYEAIAARQERSLSVDPSVLTGHLTQLFESPAFIAERYTDDQIAAATWFIFGCGSGFLHEVRSEAVPPDLQIRCIRSIATMYTDLFDRVCGRRGAEPDSDLCSTSSVDIAVYMIWDMDCLEGAVMFPESGPHLVEPAIEVLQTVLNRCRTSTCLISALHGVGHIYDIHSNGGDKAIAQRMRRMIDGFLKSRQLPEWIARYGLAAREGAIQ